MEASAVQDLCSPPRNIVSKWRQRPAYAADISQNVDYTLLEALVRVNEERGEGHVDSCRQIKYNVRLGSAGGFYEEWNQTFG